MKKIILSTAILLGALTAVTAQTDKKISAMNEKQETVDETKVQNRLSDAQDAKSVEVVEVKETKVSTKTIVQDYKEIKSSELPQVVRDGVATDFDGATISKAYVNANGDYKIELTTADAKQATVYSNAKGEWIKNDMKKQ